MEPWTRPQLQQAVVAERLALAAQLAELDADRWGRPSLCEHWRIEDVVAHLTAAARTGGFAWVRSMLGARFDPAVHNARRLREHLGADPADTLGRFRDAARSTTAASNDWAAWVGEVVVHGQDIRIPLGLPTPTPPAAAAQVVAFYVARDFAVPSRTTARGLRIEATDAPLALGDGPVVRGPAVALATALAGRPAALAALEGDGAPLLAGRIGA